MGLTIKLFPFKKVPHYLARLFLSTYIYSMYVIESSLSSSEPIMLINKQIGDDEDGVGIDGDVFQRELLSLDSMGKKRIQVWINSPGGNVLQGYNMFSAMLKTKTPVDTYNIGLCASIAAVLFMAGRKRVMSDYSQMMVHNPFDSSGQSSDDQLVSMKNSLVKMMAGKSQCKEEDIDFMMSKQTWLNAEKCKELGFCTDIENTGNSNQKYMPIASNDVKSFWKHCNNLLQTNNKKSMKKVTNKLGLVDDAAEDAIVASINAIENRATTAESKLQAANLAREAVESNLTAANEKVTELQNKIQAQEDAATKAKISVMVQSHVTAGRVKNAATAIAKWTALAEKDFDLTEETLNSLAINKTATKVEDKIDTGGEAKGYSTALVMAQVSNKLKEGK